MTYSIVAKHSMLFFVRRVAGHPGPRTAPFCADDSAEKVTLLTSERWEIDPAVFKAAKAATSWGAGVLMTDGMSFWLRGGCSG